MKERIGVLGSGVVAQTLAKGFSAKGYPVKIGSRTAEKLADFSKDSGIESGTFAEVSAFAEIVVLAVKGSVAVEALGIAGGGNLAGKIVIDTTNPIADAPPENGVLRYFTTPEESLLERLQHAFTTARFVKAWNTIGNAFMVDPAFPGGPPTQFLAGNDPEAKIVVSRIVTEFGFQAEDFGTAVSGRAIEPMCQLWCIPGMTGGGWAHAFKLLRA
jgi:8-hydroxy-5-deazaflavin:NADPH oxidoreductase